MGLPLAVLAPLAGVVVFFVVLVLRSLVKSDDEPEHWRR